MKVTAIRNAEESSANRRKYKIVFSIKEKQIKENTVKKDSEGARIYLSTAAYPKAKAI